ncbi:MAG: glutamine cyclotransferase [Alphaproteobacteria bacterium 32-64-14]|nr:MAG: glutamine cyclotransferase [Alphaproteobacteria bacterium 32-64-14]
MRTLLASVFLISACACSPSSAPATTAPAVSSMPAYSYEVVATYPHDPKAFTQGLQFADGILYETTGQEGESWVRKVDLASGAVQLQHDLADEIFGEGMVIWGDEIVTITWRSQKGFVFDKATLAPKREWTYAGEGWGLTADDTRIFMSDGTSQIRIIDPSTLQEISRIDVKMNGKPVDQLNELEYIKGEIWANVFQSDRIARIDPATGEVKGIIYLGGLLKPDERRGADVLNGIAYDKAGDRIFVTGKYWPKLFEIRVKDPTAPASP